MKKKELIALARKQSKAVNRTVKNLIVSESDFLRSQRSLFTQVTGSKRGKTVASLPTGNLNQMTKHQLESLIHIQKNFLASPYATEKGRAELKKRRLESLRENLSLDITPREYDQLIKFFNSKPEIFQQLKEKKSFGSDQVVELVQEGVKAKQLIKALQIVESKKLYHIKDGEWRVFLQELSNARLNDEKEIQEIYKRHKKRGRPSRSLK